MSLYQTFETDSSLEKTGILINYGNERFQIARAGGSNERFKKVFNQKIKPYRRQLDNDQMGEEAMEQLMAEVYSETVILGWESRKNKDAPWVPTLPNRKGEAMTFSPANCKALLLDLPELFKDLQAQASKAALFRKLEDEADAGNSEQS